MNLLRGFYGLSSPAQQADSNDAGMEMSSYKPEIEEHSDDEPFSPLAVPFMASKNGHRKSNGVHNSRLNGREMEGSLTSASNGQMSDTEVVQTSAVGDTSNERSVRRRFKTEASNATTTCYDDDCKQDMGILDKMLPVSGLLGGTEIPGGLPVAILKVLDGALVGGKGKENPVLKVRKSSSTSSLQDQTSSLVNLGAQKYGSKVEVKSAGPLNQGGARTSVDMPPKPMNYRFKAALD
eukprot:c19344_g1_i1 orf=924-1634(+)